MIYSELLFFLGVLPVSVLLSFFDRSAEYKNLILILTSVVFLSWGKPLYVLLIFSTVIAEYALGLGISALRKKSSPAAAALLLADLLMNAGVFLLYAHNYIFPDSSKLHLGASLIPIGAGYYTAKGFSYAFDVYTGKCRAEKNIFCLMTYMVSFHFLMAGPVVRYGDTEPYIRKRSIGGKALSDGLSRLVFGLGKIVILAQAFHRISVSGLEGREASVIGSWLGMAAFLAECWFSFTGLCDMAKGLGLMNGFDYEENYRDISFGELMTGYLKSANTTLVKLFSDVLGRAPGSGNAFIAGAGALIGCVLIALWYHISRMYLLVGLALGALLLLERLFLSKLLGKLPVAVKAVYVLLFSHIILGGLYFDSFSDHRHWVGTLFGRGAAGLMTDSFGKTLLANIWMVAAAFICACAPVRKALGGLLARAGKSSSQAYTAVSVIKTVFTAALLVVCVITLAAEAA